LLASIAIAVLSEDPRDLERVARVDQIDPRVGHVDLGADGGRLRLGPHVDESPSPTPG